MLDHYFLWVTLTVAHWLGWCFDSEVPITRHHFAILWVLVYEPTCGQPFLLRTIDWRWLFESLDSSCVSCIRLLQILMTADLLQLPCLLCDYVYRLSLLALIEYFHQLNSVLLLGASQCHPLVIQLLFSLVIFRSLDSILNCFGCVASWLTLFVIIMLKSTSKSGLRRLDQSFTLLLAGRERSVLTERCWWLPEMLCLGVPVVQVLLTLNLVE